MGGGRSNGRPFCEQGVVREDCQESSGKAIVPQESSNGVPKDDGDTAMFICSHGLVRGYCQACGSEAKPVCPHGQSDPELCKICGVDFMCPHSRRRAACADCSRI